MWNQKIQEKSQNLNFNAEKSDKTFKHFKKKKLIKFTREHDENLKENHTYTLLHIKMMNLCIILSIPRIIIKNKN